jgi:hypothetical protein
MDTLEGALDVLAGAARNWSDIMTSLNARDPEVAKDHASYREALERAIAQIGEHLVEVGR